MIYQIVSARPDNFGELYGQLAVDSDGFRASTVRIPSDFQSDVESLIEGSKDWNKTVHGGLTAEDVYDGDDADEELRPMPPCGGMDIERLTDEERLERIVQRLPEEFPVALRHIEPRNS